MAALTFDAGLAHLRAWCRRHPPEGEPTGPLVRLTDGSILWPLPTTDEAGSWRWEIVHESALTGATWSRTYPLD